MRKSNVKVNKNTVRSLSLNCLNNNIHTNFIVETYPFADLNGFIHFGDISYKH